MFLKLHIKKDFVSMAECGNAAYALVIEDSAKAKSFLDSLSRFNVDQRVRDSALQVTGWFSNWQNATQIALTNLLGAASLHGIGFYKSTDPIRESWIKLILLNLYTMKRCLLLFALSYISILICKPIYAGSITKIQNGHASKDQADTIITQLTNLNLSQFNGQPVDSLLAHLPGGYTTMKIGGWRSQRLAEVLYILYPNNLSVGIHVRNFQFMNPHLVNTPNPTENWSITLFKKEVIAFTIAFNGPNCINGCENVNK